MSVKVCISGLTGSGKTTAAEHLAKLLGVPHIAFSMKDEAKARGISIVELQEIAARDSRIDLEFDKRQEEEMKKHQSFVTSTWLGAWIADADLNVWLYADDEVRARRVAGRDGMPVEEARKMMLKKDAQNVERYLKLYGINIADTGKFHLCINSGLLPPDKIAAMIARCLEEIKR
ncbi:MAG: cytidylate kinase family protein [Candidatus Micrarchaeia archaeon]